MRCRIRSRRCVTASVLAVTRRLSRRWSALSTGLHATLAPVARQAEHLAVGGIGLATLRPRGDMVGFHLGNLKDHVAIGVTRGQAVRAIRTQAVLPLVGLALLVVVELPNA